jgi:hypothetical protein
LGDRVGAATPGVSDNNRFDLASAIVKRVFE